MRQQFEIAGYTLLELMLTISITAVILLMICSDFRFGFQQLRTHLVVRQIIAELYLARSEAVNRHQQIVYCAGPKNEWSSQRLVRANTVLHNFPSLPKGYHLYLRNSLGKNTAITFTPLGFTHSQLSSFTIEAPGKDVVITVNFAGRVRVK